MQSSFGPAIGIAGRFCLNRGRERLESGPGPLRKTPEYPVKTALLKMTAFAFSR